MATAQIYGHLAKTLPPRLKSFLRAHPPDAILPKSRLLSATSPATTPGGKEAAPSSALLDSSVSPSATAASSSAASRLRAGLAASPFDPFKHPATGRWHNPRYSLRQQADLVKMARANGLEELLPFTVKGTQERIRKRAEHGLRVRGTGVGQNVKGKLEERTMKSRLEKRRKAMLNMPKMILQWKERGHGRGWKEWPS